MENLLVELLIAIDIVVLQRNLLVREEHEVVDEDLGSLFEGVLRVDGTVRRDFEDELVVVGLLLDTIGLDSVLHVTDGGVNRIDCYYVNIGAEFAVLVRGHVSTTFVNGKVNLH